MEELLPRLAGTLAGANNLESLTRPLLGLLEQVTGLESTYLTYIDFANDRQHVQIARNTKSMQIPEGLAVSFGDTLCKRALEENRPYTDDVAGRWGDSDAAKALGIQTYLSQPVRHGDGELYGTLCGASSSRVPVSAHAVSVLAMFASIIGMQLDRERLVKQLQKDNVTLAETALLDPLTGIANRRALGMAVTRTLARVKRDGGSVQVAFIDLDGFKGINDELGHDAGDRFLKLIADRLKAGVRSAELVARYGGDEFVLLAEGAKCDELRQRIEGLLRGHYVLGEDATIDYPGASVGVVEADPANETAEALLQRADAAMYQAKKARKAQLAPR